MDLMILNNEDLIQINGGCGWCYIGAGLVVVGGFMTGGLLGGAIAIVGVSTVLLD